MYYFQSAQIFNVSSEIGVAQHTLIAEEFVATAHFMDPEAQAPIFGAEVYCEPQSMS